MEDTLKKDANAGGAAVRAPAEEEFEFLMGDGLDFDSLDLEALANIFEDAEAPASTAKCTVNAAVLVALPDDDVVEIVEKPAKVAKRAAAPVVPVAPVAPAPPAPVVPVARAPPAPVVAVTPARDDGAWVAPAVGSAPAAAIVPRPACPVLVPVVSAATTDARREVTRENRRRAIERWKAKRERRNWKKGPMHKTRTAAAGSRERVNGRFVPSTRGFFSVTDFAS